MSEWDLKSLWHVGQWQATVCDCSIFQKFDTCLFSYPQWAYCIVYTGYCEHIGHPNCRVTLCYRLQQLPSNNFCADSTILTGIRITFVYLKFASSSGEARITDTNWKRWIGIALEQSMLLWIRGWPSRWNRVRDINSMSRQSEILKCYLMEWKERILSGIS